MNVSSLSRVVVRVGPHFTKIEGLAPAALAQTLTGAPDLGDYDVFDTGIKSSTSNILYLWSIFPEATWEDPGSILLAARAFAFVGRLDRPKPGEYERAFPFKTQPLPFQMDIFAVARHMKTFALAPVAMGTGKTKMALDIAADKYLRGEIAGVAIVAPNGVHRQWVERAIPEHLAVACFKHVYKSGRGVPSSISPVGDRSRLRILSFNVEGFSRAGSPAFQTLRQFLQSGKIMLVIDESSWIKNPKAARTKSLLLLQRYAAVRCTLSGTPVTRGLEDLYTQFQFLDPSIIGMPSYYAFRNYYCHLVPAYRGAQMGAVKIAGYRNVDKFVEKIAPHIFIVPKDVLGLPEKTYERRPAKLTDEQKRTYKIMEQELIEDLRARKIETPANAAVRLIRLQQILCGRVVTVENVMVGDDEVPDEIECKTIDTIPNGRLETLLDVLGEHDGPAVIWARFTDDILDIKDMLEEEGHKVVTYYGATSTADRAEAVRKFREGEARYFIANPGAAGTGLDGLQVAELAVYYSNSFDAEKRWQSEDRIHRIGMRGRAHYVDLVAEDTIDTMVLDNLTRKQNLARLIYEDPGALNTHRDRGEDE